MVLEKLTVTDFAVARAVILAPGPGLNVVTGETGAGKSIIVDALDFLFGGRHGRSVVAPGAESAAVRADLLTSGQPIMIERTVRLSGRTAAHIDGTGVPPEKVRALGAELIDIHGQSEQLRLLRPAVQLGVLDAFAGLTEQREVMAAQVRELRTLRREIEAVSTDARERERLRDQLRFEVDEIESAALEASEDEALRAEQSRLANAGRLLEGVATVLASLDAPPLGEAVAAAHDIVERDPTATEIADPAATLESAASDLVRALHRYRDALDDDPTRLGAIDERLDLIARLRRKYGERVPDILAYEDSARARLEAIEGAGASLESMQARAAELADAAAATAASLSQARRAAAGGLIGAVSEELARLEMRGASLAAGFACDDDPSGLLVALPDYDVIASDTRPAETSERNPRAFTESGVDQMELLASFNPGAPPRPLAAVASGGETSRFLLALTTVLGAAAEPRLVVLDEVDEGVGGRAGSVVGQALRRLAARHQVLCVTHLPQVAAYADCHFVVTKESDGSATWSDIYEVTGERRAAELALMLGGDTPANRAVAEELLAAAAPED